jgi:hypothetical protein
MAIVVGTTNTTNFTALMVQRWSMLMAPSIGIKITNFTQLMVQRRSMHDGTKYWYQNDQPHRTDGPAVEYQLMHQVLVSK